MLDLEDPYRIIFNVGVLVLCTLLAGVASGLNLAFFSLNLTSVSSLAMGVDEKQSKRAKRILMVFQNPHWLLVTLLLLNAVAVEALPLALDDMVGPEVAIPVSVLLVLFFGEIIPQSLFVSNAVAVCGFFAYVVYFFMIVTAPLTLLLALILDKLIGHRDALFYRRRELREFLQLQGVDGHADSLLEGRDTGAADQWSDDGNDHHGQSGYGGVLDKKELKLMMGALSLSEKLVRDVMKTKIEDAMCLDIDARITKELIERVFLSGKSRIPVYEGSRENCTHYLVSKVLVLYTYKKEEDAPLLRDLALVPARFINGDELLGEAYQTLTANPMHLLFVREPGTERTIGLMTTSDVLETVHSAKFIDETDLSNTRPMQVLIKSCWNREVRGSNIYSRMSRGPSSLQMSGAYTPMGPATVRRSTSAVHNRSLVGERSRSAVVRRSEVVTSPQPPPAMGKEGEKDYLAVNTNGSSTYGTSGSPV